ncbi:MAG: nucleoid occlusion factor SlmA [Limnohabitans sp.]|nr:nucleoid occlusion factor SlmA [Limnohabitans sp.]
MDDAHHEDSSLATRRRPKPGERRTQILQTLATMLEKPRADRITTAALAAELVVSEAALYRHFASKAQMFEGLIEFIEQSLFALINQISAREGEGTQKAKQILTVILQFAEKNRGMARVMVGDALVFENARLQQRVNQLFERIESILRQVVKEAASQRQSTTPTVDANVLSSVLICFTQGRLQRFVRSGFKRASIEQLDESLSILM